jgi:hypothetical protein
MDDDGIMDLTPELNDEAGASITGFIGLDALPTDLLVGMREIPEEVRTPGGFIDSRSYVSSLAGLGC